MKLYFFGLTLLAPLLAIADPIDDPWSLVPSAPTGCYSKLDNFDNESAAALARLDETSSTQVALNKEIWDQLGDSAQVDPFELAARMQEYMMTNPSEGMKMLEAMQTTGQNIGADMSMDNERSTELTVAIDELISRYHEEYAQTRAPIDALVEKIWDGDASVDDVSTRLPGMSQQANGAYESLCARWWKSGPFDTALSELRTYQIDDSVPRSLEQFEQTRQQLDIQGIDTSEYRSTAAVDAAREYVRQLQRIYALRQPRASNFLIQGGTLSEFPDR
jgi:cell fate (sporulation/competence/biofilm development) regulator YlbF (YheA/YmcA/DUF963 family)